MRSRGAHPLRALEEGVLDGTQEETREASRGQSMQGPVDHCEGFGPYPQSN